MEIKVSEREMYYLENLIKRYSKLSKIKNDILEGYLLIRDSYNNGNKLIIAGNGGSAADSSHIVGELMKGFVLNRPLDNEIIRKVNLIDEERGKVLANKLQSPIRAITLTSQEALTTAFLNDVDGQLGFAQQMLGYADKGDTFLAISTSGNSENILYAAIIAKALDVNIVLLSGRDGGKIKVIADKSIIVPETKTYIIQEYHLPIYHTICLMLEEYYFGGR